MSLSDKYQASRLLNPEINGQHQSVPSRVTSDNNSSILPVGHHTYTEAAIFISNPPSPVLGKIIFEMISNQNQNHESLIDLKS